MKIKKVIISIKLLLLASFFMSCNKTEDFEGIDLLLDKEWHLTSVEQGVINITETCDLDDVLTFEDASNFNYDLGGIMCYENEGNKESLKWKLIDNFTVIRMKFNFNEGINRAKLIEYWEIVELNDTLLVVQDNLESDQDPEIRTYNY